MPYAFPWDPPSNPYWKSPNSTTPTLPTTGAGTGPAPGVSGTTSGTVYTAGAPPDLSSLTDLINSLNQKAQTASNAARIPNASALEDKSSTYIGSLLSGELPTDVTNQLSRAAAERGIATGSPGSPNSNASLLQSLGLNSLMLKQLGETNLSEADKRNPGAPIFDPTTQLLTPAQAGQLNNQGNQLALEWFKALNPNYGRTTSGGGGGGGQTSGGQPPNTDWFSRALAQVTPNSTLPPRTTSPVYGPNGAPTGTVNTPDSSYYNPFGLYYPTNSTDPGYNPPPANTYTGSTSSSYDPFLGYDTSGGGSVYNPQPDNTVTTDTSSNYEPFSGYY